MTHLPSEGKADARENEANPDRRDFLKGAVAAGLLGTAGLAPTLAQSVAAGQQVVEDPQAPPGLRPQAQPDGRFPMTYETSVPETMRLVTQYFAALTRRDLQGMAQTLHFPFVTYEGIEPVVVESADQLMANPPQSMNVTGKGDHQIPSGAYDILEHIELLIYNPVGAGVSVDSSRYRADGEKLVGCNAIYGVTNNDGKWGIEYMSTIFKAADQLSETYDAEAFLKAVHDGWRDHDLGRRNHDLTGFPFVGRFVSVNIGGSNATSGPAREGHPMEPYRVKGVKSRLRVQEITQEEIDHPSAAVVAARARNEAQFLSWSGGGVGKWDRSLEFPGPQGHGSRILCATTDKAHVYTGFSRYTADGTLISETRYISVIFYRKGVWVAGDTPFCAFVGQMYRDRTNDMRPSWDV